MNLKLSFLIIIFLNYSLAFIPYPFLTDNLLKLFLNELKIDQIDLENFTLGYDCQRKCIQNDRRICHFNMTIKAFQIMSGYVTFYHVISFVFMKYSNL